MGTGIAKRRTLIRHSLSDNDAVTREPFYQRRVIRFTCLQTIAAGYTE